MTCRLCQKQQGNGGGVFICIPCKALLRNEANAPSIGFKAAAIWLSYRRPTGEVLGLPGLRMRREP